MKITKNEETGLFNLEGMTEGKVLCLHRLTGNKLDASDKKNGLELDLSCALENGVQNFRLGLAKIL